MELVYVFAKTRILETITRVMEEEQKTCDAQVWKLVCAHVLNFTGHFHTCVLLKYSNDFVFFI